MATIYDHVTRTVCEALERGVVPWIKPWSEDSKASSPWGLPTNIAKGKEYRGANILILWGQAKQAQYQCDDWLTQKQAAALGGSVLKGERPTWVHFWKWDERDVRGERKRVPMLRAYRVFNVAQTQGCELPTRSAVRELGAGAIEDRVRKLGARVRLGGNRAYFDPNNDRIAVPLPERFKSPDAFHSTVLHELTHWTGHTPRLNRGVANHFGTPEYAREELIAELGSAFLCARFGIALDGLQHPEYLQSWIKVLRSDSRAILQAASGAQKAADFIMGEQFDPDRKPDADAEPEPEAAPIVPVVLPEPVQAEPAKPDHDTMALAADYVCQVVRALYWAGHADALDRDMAERAEQIARKREAESVDRFDRLVVKSARKRARSAVRPVPMTSTEWHRHPVTGYPLRLPEGRTLADVVPFVGNAEALAQVRREWRRHGRLGAAQIIVGLERDGLRSDASHYRKGLVQRRHGEGSVRYNYAR
jgi:antirestriction protein ArdC